MSVKARLKRHEKELTQLQRKLADVRGFVSLSDKNKIEAVWYRFAARANIQGEIDIDYAQRGPSSAAYGIFMEEVQPLLVFRLASMSREELENLAVALDFYLKRTSSS